MKVSRKPKKARRPSAPEKRKDESEPTTPSAVERRTDAERELKVEAINGDGDTIRVSSLQAERNIDLVVTPARGSRAFVCLVVDEAKALRRALSICTKYAKGKWTP